MSKMVKGFWLDLKSLEGALELKIVQ